MAFVDSQLPMRHTFLRMRIDGNWWDLLLQEWEVQDKHLEVAGRCLLGVFVDTEVVERQYWGRIGVVAAHCYKIQIVVRRSGMGASKQQQRVIVTPCESDCSQMVQNDAGGAGGNKRKLLHSQTCFERTVVSVATWWFSVETQKTIAATFCYEHR